ncbi:energy-coupling factor ABC transporter ATP-binding protein [Sinimarinibacterium flocculans]|uniref:Cobalt/nickel transport system ATP-binding protein n=1 Tax=Sinimarinibacterium flocculans TaxID=985250 RepID=A0A318E5B2_9GAMM|nr:ABC transporter ATP-binding protein [Sinimarinibacterium flocculans]PXV65683.1 cobalt/nickel transport system ATP-binding protein [Sinimarinibacterium flocculans]
MNDPAIQVPLIRVRNLAFRYHAGRPLLEGVLFELRAGERLGVSGANGSGKSSLLQLLMGLERPAAGTVELFGHLCRDEVDFRPLRGRIGLLFQDADDQLFCPTVEEDVAFGPLNQGYSHAQVRGIVARTLADLGLAHLAQRPTHQLSGGEKRAVALAGVLAMQPDVLLLDEPTTCLDEDAQARVTRLLLGLPQAMVIVSHDPHFLRCVASRTLLLRDGALCAMPVVRPVLRSV